MSGFGLLYGVDRKRSDRVDTKLIKGRVCHWFGYLRDTHGLSPYDLLTDGFRFQGSYLAKAPQMPLGLAEPGRQESLDQIPGYGRSHGSAAHADDVHVVVFHALPRREMVVDKGGADARNFVGAD